jgi:hypothetical protein
MLRELAHYGANLLITHPEPFKIIAVNVLEKWICAVSAIAIKR